MKKRNAAAAGLLLIFSILSAAFPCLAEEASPVIMEVSAVYGTTGRKGSHIPLHVELYGQSGSPFSGSLSVDTMESGNDSSAEVYRYTYPVTVGTAETKAMELYVPLGQKSSEIMVQLFDEKGKELDIQHLSFDVSKDRGRLLIGALSDRPERLSYLDGVNLDYGMVRSMVFPLEADTLPADARGLELLDMLVINEAHTDSLTEEQREAVLSWVKEGGVLLFGTGVNARETLGAFGELFVEYPIGIPKYKSVSMGTEYARETPGDAAVSMYCVDISMPGGRDTLMSDGSPILTMEDFGSGQVGIFSFDLGDIKAFSEKNPAYPMGLFMEVLGEERISNLFFYGAYGHNEDYWSAQSLVNGGSADRLPNLPLYTALLAGYIILIGPGLYLFLKKKDLSRYYGTSVMVSSLLCGALVYLVGTGTRFDSEFYTYATVLSVDGDQVEETSFFNIRTPDSRPFSVDIAGDYQVTALTRSDQWYGEEREEAFDGKKQWNVNLTFGEEATTLAARRSRAFEPRFFKAERTGEDPYLGGIGSKLTYFDGKLSGTITNYFPFALENAAIISYGQVLPLEGRLEAGETRTFSGEPLLTWPVGNSYMLSSLLAGAGGAEEGMDRPSNEEYLHSVGRTELYAYHLGERYGAYTPDMVLMAFGPERGIYEAFRDSGSGADGKVLYSAALRADREKEGRIYISGQRQKPKITSGSGAAYGDSMILYGSDPLAVEYYLGTDLEVEKLSFLPVSEEFFQDPGYRYLRIFDGEASFFNNRTRSYDAVDLKKQEFTMEELAPYLSSDNRLVVQYAGDSKEPEYSLMLPHLMVTGRKR